MCWGRTSNRRRNFRRRQDERGSGTLELVVVFPVVLLVIFMTVQGALYFHARSVALSAAQEGLRVARAENGSSGEGGEAARSFITQAGGADVLTDVKVTTQRTAATAKSTVSGRPLSVIPGLMNFSVSQTAAGPVERFTSPGGGS